MAASNGSGGRVTFGDHAHHILTGDLSFTGWFFINGVNNAGSFLFTIEGASSGETEIDNILANLQLGTKTGSSWKLKYIHESGAGVDTTFETTGLVTHTSYFPVVVTRNATTKKIRIVTPFFDETSPAYSTNPTTTDTTAHFVVGNNSAGTATITSSLYEKISLWNRVLNDSEIAAFMCGYAPNQANMGATGQLYYATLNTAASKDEGSGGGTVATGGTVTFPFVAMPLLTSGAPTGANKTLVRLEKFPTSNVIAAGAVATYCGAAGASTQLGAGGLPNPTNLYAQDGTLSTQATARHEGYINHYSGFDFTSIPSNASIVGATTLIYRYCDTGSSSWFTYEGMWSGLAAGVPSGLIDCIYGSVVNIVVDEPQGAVSATSNLIHYPTRQQLQASTFNIHAGHGRSSNLVAVTGNIDSASVVVWYLSNASRGAPAAVRGPIAKRRRMINYLRRR